MKRIHLASLLAAAALSACGGGGGDDTVADNGNTTQATDAAADKYVGTWATGCFTTSYTASGAPDVPLNQITTATYEKVSATELSVVLIANIYPASSGCTGTPVQLPHAATRNRLTIDASVTVDGQAADKVSLFLPAIDPGISAGANIVLNGIVLPGNFFTQTGTYKELFAVVGSQLLAGTDTEGADGYPTAIDPTDPFTRQ